MAALNPKRTSSLGWITDLICFLVLGVGLALWVSTALRSNDAQPAGAAVPDTHNVTGQAYDARPRYI